MPPKKRKNAEIRDESSTDDESSVKATSIEAKKTKRTFSIFEKQQAGKPKAGNLKFDLKWQEHGEPVKSLNPVFYLSSNELEGCEKIAAFDIDFTIIKTKSGKKFPTNSSDWMWFDKAVVENLRALNTSGYRVLFVTNQAGIEKKRVNFEDLRKKFNSMVIELDIPIFVFVATGENHFRKPSIEIWNFFVKACNKSVEIKMSESFYVGDAAGRPKNWAVGKNKDFSCVDRMFAYNIGLNFHTPEEYFLKHKVAPFEWRSINPNDVLKSAKKSSDKKEYHKKEQEIVLMVGPPASGKSTFVKKYLIPFKYVHVNRDTLGTPEKCLKVAESALTEGKSVIVDNTNPNKVSRTAFIQLAKKHKLKHIRCFKMNTVIELCHHLNYVRQNQTKGAVRRIPDVGYNMYKSKYEEPVKSEHFTEIVSIDFEPEFETEHHEKIFKQWTD